MLKIIVTSLTVSLISFSINSQIVNIPDANFKNWLLNNSNLNTNGDSEIQVSEANSYSSAINVWSKNISDLTGIEAFPNIIQLDCRNNQLTSLDVSNNPNLNLLRCNNNNLTSLNMRNISTSTMSVQSFFNATVNPNLTCIEVDNVSDAQNTWVNIDTQTSFNTSCNGSTVLVSSISVQGQNNINSISNTGGQLQMEAIVAPANSTNSSYTWSITNGTGSATINSSGLVSAISDGNITVTATANDASGVTGQEIINISNQSVSIGDEIEKRFKVYPNPVKNVLSISSLNSLEDYDIEINDPSGKIIQTNNENTNKFDLSFLKPGIYFMLIKSNHGSESYKIIKE